jgi:membrane associated rhomboid family serine protease
MRTSIAWPPFTENLQYLIGTLAGLFFLSVLFPQLHAIVFETLLVSQESVFERFQIWTLLTYGLWHADASHLFFNGFALWMFGGHIDRRWSNRRFWWFNMWCLLGGGILVVLAQLLVGYSTPTLGYSSAVMGLLAAFCWYNWNRQLYFFVFPLTGKQLLLVFFALDLLLVVGMARPVSIAGHIGGALTGLFILGRYWRVKRLKLLWRRIKRYF